MTAERLQEEQDDHRTYEVSFLSALTGVLEKVLELVRTSGAEIIHQGQTVSIKFAYAIKKQSAGYFSYVQFRGTPRMLAQIKDGMESHREILRFLLVKNPLVRGTGGVETAKEEIPREPSHEQVKESRAEPLTNEALEAKLEEILK